MDENIKLSTGTTFYPATLGIVGLGPDLQLASGRDQLHTTPDDISDLEREMFGDTPELTHADCVELADIMIKRWEAFRAKHAAQAAVNGEG